MTQFNTTKLVDSRVLVEGTDIFGTSGKTIVDSSQWEAIKADREFKTATSDFDKAVEEFFKPLTEAAEKVEKKISRPKPDAIDYVVLQEEVEGVPAQKAQMIKLTHDSVVLRLIEDGQYKRLVWVNDTLEVIAEQPPVTEDTEELVDSGSTES